jgi:hypothetical protein
LRHHRGVDEVLRYRGRGVTSDEIASISELIESSPGASRRAISLKLCELWDWRQENGAPRDMVCRGLLLALERAGHITLPPVRWRPAKPPRRRVEKQRVLVAQEPIEGSLASLGPLSITQVRRTPDEALVEQLVTDHHYLGYARPVGEHLKYLVRAGDRPIACFCWSSAARHLGLRDRYVGWSPAARRANVRFIAYQTRFLILPWVRVPHLASHLLGRMSRQLSSDWEKVYAHPIYFTETFVEPERFRGTCYRAANWVELGATNGRGNNARTHAATRPVKTLYVWPLVKNFRELLSAE